MYGGPNEERYGSFPQNMEKVRKRKALLAEHPELRLRLDKEKLKAIIDYDDFICNPKSSVARDEAIKGSDIDGGIVILREPTETEQQMAFIEELRRQGFSAYHQKEYEEIKQRSDALPLYEMLKLSDEKTKRDLNRVHFYTRQELDEMKNAWTSVNAIYQIGKSIG